MSVKSTEDYRKLIDGGVLLIDKPYEWTSFDVVNKIRFLLTKTFNQKKVKVGHAGTLDPLATGLLILCTGKMTKQIESFQAQDKTYTGEMILGATRPSYDMETEINKTFDITNITNENIHQQTASFTGEIGQMPPAFSAVKVAGKRAYEAAREGKQLELKKRTVKINRFDITEISLPAIYFSVDCSKGTYIRSLVHDFGAALNNGAYLSSLKRTQIGDCHLKDAISVEEFENKIKEFVKIQM